MIYDLPDSPLGWLERIAAVLFAFALGGIIGLVVVEMMISWWPL